MIDTGNDTALCRPVSVISTKGRLNRQERFEQPTKFAGSKFERPKVGLKGELQDVIRNAGPKGEGQEPVVNLLTKHARILAFWLRQKL